MLNLQASGGFEVGAAEGAEVILGEDLFDLFPLLVSEVSVLVKLRLKPLNLLEPVHKLGARSITHEVVDLIGLGCKALRLHELVHVGDGLLEFVDDRGSHVNQPYLSGPILPSPGEKRYGEVYAGLLLAKVEDVAVGLGRIEDAIGARECLDQTVVLEVLVDVNSVEVHGVKAGKKHVNDDGDINLFLALVGQVTVGELLILDALLDILIVEVEIVEVVVCPILVVVVSDNGLESGFFPFRVVPIVFLLLGEILLNLLNVLVALCRRREDGGNLQGHELTVGGFPLSLQLLENLVILNGIVDRCGC